MIIRANYFTSHKKKTEKKMQVNKLQINLPLESSEEKSETNDPHEA